MKISCLAFGAGTVETLCLCLAWFGISYAGILCLTSGFRLTLNYRIELCQQPVFGNGSERQQNLARF